MKSLLKLYGKFFGMNLKTQLQYKGSFLMMFFGQFLTAFSGFLMIYFLFDRFNAVENFSVNEVLLCYATAHISFVCRKFSQEASILSVHWCEAAISTEFFCAPAAPYF